MNTITTNYYAMQNADATFDVWKNVQEWESCWPIKDLVRERIHTGLTREYADCLVRAYSKQFAHQVKHRIEIYEHTTLGPRNTPAMEGLPSEMRMVGGSCFVY